MKSSTKIMEMTAMATFDIVVGSGCLSTRQASSSQETTMTPDVLYLNLIPQLNTASIARFLEKIDNSHGNGPKGDCWVWTGYKNKGGYGELTIRPNKFMSHRLMWILEYGYLEKELHILHSCDFPSCCRPEHLRKGTQVENMQDCVVKGRHRHGKIYGEKVGNHKLSREQVLEIREKYNNVRRGYKAIGAAYGVSDVLIGAILRGKIWKNTDPSTPNKVKTYVTVKRDRIVSRQEILQPIDKSYRFIPLTQGQCAVVDAADYEWLAKWNWYAKWENTSGSFYAARNSRVGEGKPHIIRMHSQIMGLSYGDYRTVDHCDSHATLDNRRSNLRIATKAEQSRNTIRSNPSGYKGVTPIGNKWQAQIGVQGGKVHLGYRATAEEAHFELYVPAAIKHHGEFASLI